MRRPWTTWDDVEELILTRPPTKDLHIPKQAVPSPESLGMKRSIGVPHGSWRHFRRPLQGPGCLHIREYPTHYEAHWDRVDPTRNLLGHFWADVRGTKFVAAALGLAIAAAPFAVL